MLFRDIICTDSFEEANGASDEVQKRTDEKHDPTCHRQSLIAVKTWHVRHGSSDEEKTAEFITACDYHRGRLEQLVHFVNPKGRQEGCEREHEGTNHE